jgi:hypothetical protein
MNNLRNLILYLFIFLLPTQLAYHFWPSWSYVYGIRIDFLAPAIYLTDILAVFLIVCFAVDNKLEIVQYIKKHTYFLLFILLPILNIVFSTSPFESLYRWIKVLEFLGIFLYFKNSKFINPKLVVYTLFGALTSFSLIGIGQFFKGGTIGGLIYYLGERTFTLGTPGIALVSILGELHLRAYSTFSHPNSLAGFFGASVLFILLSNYLKRNPFTLFGIILIVFCFILSFSISAFLAIFLILCLYLTKNNKKLFLGLSRPFFVLVVMASLISPLISPSLITKFLGVGDNVTQRIDLTNISGKMISTSFLIGKGLGTFIVNIPTYKGIFSYSWLLQPVHNIFLLVFTETGIFGIIFFTLFFNKYLRILLTGKNYKQILIFVFIVLTGLTDHYWLTLQQNFMLLSLLMGLSLR